jgi:hypothetical protein
VTILMAHRKPCGVDAHFLPLTFKGQLALASLAPSGPFWPGARLLHFAAAPRSKTAGSNQSEPRTCVELRGLEPLASCMPYDLIKDPGGSGGVPMVTSPATMWSCMGLGGSRSVQGMADRLADSARLQRVPVRLLEHVGERRFFHCTRPGSTSLRR